MDLKSLIKTATKAELLSLADACEHSVGHIRNIAYGCEGKKCSIELAAALERESLRLFGRHRMVMREDLIPDEWAKHWPELKTKQKARLAMRRDAPRGAAAQAVATA